MKHWSGQREPTLLLFPSWSSEASKESHSIFYYFSSWLSARQKKKKKQINLFWIFFFLLLLFSFFHSSFSFSSSTSSFLLLVVCTRLKKKTGDAPSFSIAVPNYSNERLANNCCSKSVQQNLCCWLLFQPSRRNSMNSRGTRSFQLSSFGGAFFSK